MKLRRLLRKTKNVGRDIARPVTALARGKVSTAGRALAHGVTGGVGTVVAMAARRTLNVEKSRDLANRVTDRAAKGVYNAILGALGAPVKRAVGSKPINASLRRQVVASTSPISIATGTAVAGAAGAAAATALHPKAVNEIMDRLLAAQKKVASVATSATVSTTSTSADTTSKPSKVPLIAAGLLAIKVLL